MMHRYPIGPELTLGYRAGHDFVGVYNPANQLLCRIPMGVLQRNSTGPLIWLLVKKGKASVYAGSPLEEYILKEMNA